MLRMTPLTKNLLICNVLAFIAMLAARQLAGVDLNDWLGLHFMMASDFHVYQLFTYMFMHAGWEHIILNMFMLWMFGTVVENALGARRFLFYYIFCDLGAGVMQELAQTVYVYVQLNAQHPLGFFESFSVMHQLSGQLNGLTTVGASGAIYALLLAFGMMFPDERMFIIPIPIPIKAKWMVMGSIAVELFSALGSPGDNVAHLAHLGGMVFGFALMRYWRRHPYGMGSGYGPGAGDLLRRMKFRWQQRYGEARRDEGARENPDWEYNARQRATQEEIDRILDKIRASGYDSLSREEKQRLFEQSNKG